MARKKTSKKKTVRLPKSAALRMAGLRKAPRPKRKRHPKVQPEQVLKGSYDIYQGGSDPTAFLYVERLVAERPDGTTYHLGSREHWGLTEAFEKPGSSSEPVEMRFVPVASWNSVDAFEEAMQELANNLEQPVEYIPCTCISETIQPEQNTAS